MSRARSCGLLLGFTADRLLGDPHRWHPVAGFGGLATSVEARWYADSRARGLSHTTLLVGTVAVLGLVAERAASRGHSATTLATAIATWTVLGGRSLEREADAVRAHLAAGDIVAARQRVRHLVGRDVNALDEREIARAAIESLAENTSDAVVAPLVWGAIAGVPGVLAYRAANTLDAMVGHHTARYEHFGWAAARLDDVLNIPGSRLTGLLAVALGEDPAGAWRAWQRDAGAHPSPNAGVAEAAFAGALGIRLVGANVYGEGPDRRTEHRVIGGAGRPPTQEDLPRASLLARRVGLGAAAATAAFAWLLRPGTAER